MVPPAVYAMVPPAAFSVAVITDLPDLLPCGSAVGTGCSDCFHFKSYPLLDAFNLAWGTPGLLLSSPSSLSTSGAAPTSSSSNAGAAPALSSMLNQSFHLQPSCTLTRMLRLLQRAPLPSSRLSYGLQSMADQVSGTHSNALHFQACIFSSHHLPARPLLTCLLCSEPAPEQLSAAGERTALGSIALCVNQCSQSQEP